MTFDRRTAMGLGAAGLAAMAVPGLAAPAGSRFRVEGNDFLLDGKPFQILAGEMHYPRIPRAVAGSVAQVAGARVQYAERLYVLEHPRAGAGGV